jgi:hypothetical protein
MKIKHVYGNVLRIDIPLTIKIINSENGETHEVEEPFYPDTSKPVLVELANQCYGVTERHKAAIVLLQTVRDVEGYDFTEGYPEKLRFEV